MAKSRRAAFATGSRCNLVTQWKSFIIFCSHFDLIWLPTTSLVLSLYAQFLSRTFQAPSSIRNYISGIKTLHCLLELPTDIFHVLELRLAVRGISRLNPHCPKRASPITPAILHKIYSILDLSIPSHTVFWSLFLLAFFTLSRKSNLVTSGKKHSSKQVSRGDIQLGTNGLMVNFNWTKTIQFGQKVLQIPLVAMTGSKLCPVKAYSNMVSMVPAPNGSPAFVLPSSVGVSPVTYIQFQTFLRSCINQIGLSPSDYSSHSFRRGGATWAFKAKVPSELIKVQGDWLSSAYMVYLEFSTEQRLQVCKSMMQAIQNSD